MILLKNNKSKSAYQLAKALKIPKRTLPTLEERDIYQPIINWGVSKAPEDLPYINHPKAIALACNKVKCFRTLEDKGVPTVPYSLNKNDVISWFDDQALFDFHDVKVFCRTLVSSSQGKGIVIAKSKDELVDAPLYTLWIHDCSEYRVHAALGRVLIQKKKRLSEASREARGITDINPLIKNTDNGWVFSTLFEVSQEGRDILSDIGIQAVSALGLDFGAVDILFNKDTLAIYVLEVNTAPGLSDITLEFYTDTFEPLIKVR